LTTFCFSCYRSLTGKIGCGDSKRLDFIKELAERKKFVPPYIGSLSRAGGVWRKVLVEKELRIFSGKNEEKRDGGEVG